MTVVMILTDFLKYSPHILSSLKTVTQTKQITIHPNNKKWVTKDMKSCLVDKKKAFLQGDKVRMRELQKEFKRKAKLAKVRYKDEVEKKLTSGNAREAWQGLNIMMGRATKPVMAAWTEPTSLAEQLNTFFTRFNSTISPITWTPPQPPALPQKPLTSANTW